jgi:hypothetical protein
MDGAIPQGPEIIVFNSLVSSVSIWASGGSFDGLFQLEAFDASDASLGIVQVPTFADWELLSFVGPSISKVQLTELSGIQAYVYDDLSFEPVALSNIPEPGAVVLFASGLVGLVGLRRFKERHFPAARNRPAAQPGALGCVIDRVLAASARLGSCPTTSLDSARALQNRPNSSLESASDGLPFHQRLNSA